MKNPENEKENLIPIIVPLGSKSNITIDIRGLSELFEYSKPKEWIEKITEAMDYIVSFTMPSMDLEEVQNIYFSLKLLREAFEKMQYEKEGSHE